MGPTLGNYWKFPNYVELGSNASKLWQGKAGEQFVLFVLLLSNQKQYFCLMYGIAKKYTEKVID